MKYILKKKWHESQVEEVGHVFEENIWKEIIYGTNMEEYYNDIVKLKPHEIALLVDAGYLEKVCSCNSKEICTQCGITSQKTDTTLDLWTTEPPEGTQYYALRYSEGFETDGMVEVDWYTFSETMRLFHLYNLHTNNCHKTQKSAEEALKRLLEN